MKFDEVLHEMIRKLDKIKQKTQLDLDKNLLIFHYYKWNREKLESNYFQQMQQVFSNLGFDKQPQLKKENSDESAPKHCIICYDQSGQFPQTVCGHRVCQICLMDYFNENIPKKNVILSCVMSGCPSFLRHSFIESILVKAEK